MFNSATQYFPPLDVETDPTNMGTRWKKWIDRFDNFLDAFNITEDRRKKSMLLHFIGEKAHEIFLTLPEPENPNALTQQYELAKLKFSQYFVQKPNIEFEIYQFRQSKQQPEETIDQFYARLLKLSTHCEFTDVNKEIKSQIILATINTDLRKYALRESPTLEQLLNQAKILESTKRQLSIMEQPKEAASNDKIVAKTYPKQEYKRNKNQHGNNKKYKENENEKIKTCLNCGNQWHKQGRKSCPAYGKTCNKCRKYGHFAKVCLSTKNNSENTKTNIRYNARDKMTTEQDDDDSSKESSFSINVNNINETPKANININGSNIKVIIDTGTSVNLISSTTYNQLWKKPTLTQDNTSIYSYNSQNKLPIMGKFIGHLCHGTKTVNETIYVLKGDAESLLSYRTAKTLGLINITVANINSLNRIDEQYIKHNYSELINRTGKLRNFKVHLHIDNKVLPVAQQHRRIPFHLRKQVEQEIIRLEKAEIIEKAEGPTLWVSPVVIVPKAGSNKIRLCVDMRMVNTAIKRERHITPTLDDFITQLNGCCVFSKIDLSEGYHQLELDEQSKTVTTFSTHLGLYRYKRLNFGISSAAEIFQNTIRQLLANIKGALNYSDDILIFGTNQQEHDEALMNVLNKLKQENLTINLNKCCFNQNQITFLGYNFSKEGIKPDQNKVEAMVKMDPPTNISEVRSLLGMFNYVGRFLPHLANNTFEIRQLLNKDVEFKWTEQHQEKFNILKQQLKEATTLTYFDINKELHLFVDAGPTGLGGILTQQTNNSKYEVIAYASRSLTKTEQKYSQVEKEMLAVAWGMKHFHLYIMGTHFYVHTDHRPLLSILQNPLSIPSARIERLILKIQQYQFTAIHQKGTNNPSDFLSRHPYINNSKEDEKTENYVKFVVTNSMPKAINIEEIKQATLDDVTLQTLKETILQKNLEDKTWTQQLKPFKNIRSELTTYNELILRGQRIVLPDSLQLKAIELAHKSHLGIVKTKQLLRTKVWFPEMDKKVEEVIKKCLPCQTAIDNKQRDPIQPTKMSLSTPFETLAVDFCGPFSDSKYIFVVIDEFSRYPIAEITKSTRYEDIELILSKIFTTFGVPNKLKSDNGPPFQSQQFKDFLKSWGVQHCKVTPYWPEGNGTVERFMKTLKKHLICTEQEQKKYSSELNTFLFNYRMAPHESTNKSPFELLFGRSVSGILPTTHTLLNQTQKEAIHNDTKYKRKINNYANKRRNTHHHTFKVGDLVFCKQLKTSKLSPPFERDFYKIIKINGTQIIAARGEKIITRNASFFKLYPKHSNNNFQAKKKETLSIEKNQELKREKRKTNIPSYLKDYQLNPTRGGNVMFINPSQSRDYGNVRLETRTTRERDGENK